MFRRDRELGRTPEILGGVELTESLSPAMKFYYSRPAELSIPTPPAFLLIKRYEVG